ncbi:MAG: cytochrome c oxidase subunit 3 [Wolbachia endosymbiont of Menacanthus eurysternus]|nr:MAG: cytochrome c oxidase subunit 3 [Wolbachia endosymbiont of Menacanthus eurysternus]
MKLIDPSPWPIFLSKATLIFVFGLIGAFRKQTFGIISLILGTFIILGVLFHWWKDIIKEAIYEPYTKATKKGFRIAMYLFILSEVIFFATFFCSFFNAWLDSTFLFEISSHIKKIDWPPNGIPPHDPWSLPFINTLILLLSGTTINWTHRCLLENDKKNMIKMLLITILLGLLFIIIQAIEYYKTNFSLREMGEKIIYISNFYIITGFHCAHLMIGMLFLLICLFRAHRNQFTPQNHLCLEFASLYWHFIDIVWIFLFIFIYWLGGS